MTNFNLPFLAALFVVGVSSILGPLIVAKYKNYLIKKNKEEDPLVTSIESNKLVDEQLRDIKEELKVDRIWVSQFHNGGNFFPTGKSISKFSITFEHTEPGVPSLSEIFKNIPVSLFNEPLRELYENNEVLIPDFKNDERLGLNKFSSPIPPKSTYMFALKTLDGLFIGNLGVEYINRKKKLSEDDLQFIRNKSIAIGTIISTYLYKTD